MNILIRSYLVVLAFLLAGAGYGQDKYAVYFADKEGVTFDPYSYFHPKAIERRIRHGLPLDHQTDWPVNSSYVSQVSARVDSVKMTSRWFNLAVVWAQPDQIQAIEALAFVKSVELLLPSEVSLAGETVDENPFSDENLLRTLAHRQTDELQIKAFREAGFTGKGVRVAIFDIGFPGVDNQPVFNHIRARGGIKHTFDFVKHKEFVYSYGTHGTNVMSNVCGIWDTIQMGMAPDADILLARTEMAVREPFSEEENWLQAAEWADKHGADIINSSLGYTSRRYFPEQMDGRSAFVTKAAVMAARKGILVVNAAGNEGDDESWRVIAAPADADSVLSIGGVDPGTGFHISFSSFGPTADKRMKPNVSAFGKAAVAKPIGIGTSYGTSFASPLIAGFAACVLQANPNLTNMELKEQIEKSGNLYPYYDYAHGYGMPQADFFTVEDREVAPETFDIEETEFTYRVKIRDDYYTPADTSENIWSQYLKAEDADVTEDYLYYHFENKQGYLSKYFVIRVGKQEPLSLFKQDLHGISKLRVHYRGYTITKDL